jgi:hypothetical protein
MAEAADLIDVIREAHRTLFMHRASCTAAQRHSLHDDVRQGLDRLEAAIAEKELAYQSLLRFDAENLREIDSLRAAIAETKRHEAEKTEDFLRSLGRGGSSK